MLEALGCDTFKQTLEPRFLESACVRANFLTLNPMDPTSEIPHLRPTRKYSLNMKMTEKPLNAEDVLALSALCRLIRTPAAAFERERSERRVVRNSVRRPKTRRNNPQLVREKRTLSEV